VTDYQSRLANLRIAIAEAHQLQSISPEMGTQMMIQLLNGAESIKQKAISEKERLKGLIGQCEGQILAAETQQDLIVNLITATNRAAKQALEEEVRQAQERKEAAEAMVETAAAGTERTVENPIPNAFDVVVQPLAAPTEPPRPVRVKKKDPKP
jgi:DNA-directed RNA polymerase beta' subunit